MRYALIALFSLCIVANVASWSRASEPTSSDTVDYVRDIKPILSNSCYTCHGPDEEARKADLRFDRRDAAIASAIVPGDAAASELIQRITSEDPDVHMPPPTSQRPRLDAKQIGMLTRWIDQGANFQSHWAYAPPERPTVPDVSEEHASAVANPIDSFVIARLEREGISPAPPADPRTQIRRLAFDVTGLPPTPEQVATYTQQLDSSSSSYRALVNKMLSKPAFGERLTAYWLDVVRYGDSVGIHGDQLVSMSPYRDYVLKAFNENMPYDQFITEQLAGDLLPGATLDQKVASAFNRMHMITAEGGAQPKEYLAIYAADRVRNTSAALLGTTLGCAQCHDHKFDPFTAKEFYEFASFFADLKETGVYGGNNWFPKLQVPEPGQSEKLADLVALMKAAESEVPKDAGKEDPKKKAYETAKKQKDAYEKTIPTVLVSQSVEPREMRLLPRGNWLDESGPVVQPGFPSTLTVDVISPETGRLGRRELADWMIHPSNPLVARVFVNRLWKLMIGQGIVTTLDDFGSQGSVPSHPQLLDWLAVEFIESGWNIKHIVRLIATSNTYRQSSTTSPELRERDPENQLLARQNRFRLDAEAVRDNALAVSGLLVEKIGGKSVRPYQPTGYYAHLNFPRREYQASKGDDLYRRSVYTHWQRTFVHPSLMAFDAPSREECTVNRPRSNTPLQSLVLLNDPIYVEAARKLAERVLLETDSDQDRLTTAFELALQRSPSTDEETMLLELHAEHLARYKKNSNAADDVLKNGEATVDSDIDKAELAAWTSLSRVLLSLHETITRY